MLLLGYDIGSSSIKASVLDAQTGECLKTAFYPKEEMKINAPQSGWAEQEPEMWWENIKIVTKEIFADKQIDPSAVKAIGISYQMHGLVLVDKQHKALRPSIIWCDSRAVEYGNKAFKEIGEQHCLQSLLNSPGNFTASKLKWVKENEPALYNKIYKIMLPGDFIAMKLTGIINTTVSGLSEGIFWDFSKNQIAGFLLDYYGFDSSFIPDIVPTFAHQGELQASAAAELGLPAGIPIAYRAGDQPNNALSLNVLNPGEIAATAGTSGVVYGVSDQVQYDDQSRVNTFAHVNHTNDNTRLGVLLCINGTGILNSWLKKNVTSGLSYEGMNASAATVAIGSEGLSVLPFGNGAERVLNNRNMNAHFCGLNFNIHTQAHLLRAAQEGIVFSFKYGIDIMANIGIKASVIRAGKANMFLSPVFREALSSIMGATIELYNTDGSQGAARAAGIGAGIYKSPAEAFAGLKKLETVEPDKNKHALYEAAYAQWLTYLSKF